jgi:hypothetical protein
VSALVALAAVLSLAAPRPAAPVVSGPRDTTVQRPVYTFRARGATGFRCAFDTRALHRCARRYSQHLEPGAHVLRVRSVGRRGALSRVVSVRVRVRLPVPDFEAGPTVSIGAGAGSPAPHANGVWVPVTSDGTLVRVVGPDVLSRTAVGVPTSSPVAFDAAVADDRRSTEREIWSASDAGAQIVSVDPRTAAVTGRFDVAARPAGLAQTNEAVWAFHFLQGTITRIDIPTRTERRLEVPGAKATGIAWSSLPGETSLWLLTTQPARVLALDPTTAAVKRTIDLPLPFARRASLVDAWRLTFAGGALWATLPSSGRVARIDLTTGAIRYIRIPYGVPFGITGAGSVWVATDHAVVQLDERTGALQAAALVPAANRTGIVSIVFGYASLWLTNYDRGTLTTFALPPPSGASRRK